MFNEELVIAAEKDVAYAQYELAVHYENEGKDAEKALYWYTKAADNGHARAQFILSCMYAEGYGTARDGKLVDLLDKDLCKSYEYALKAAKQGLPEAMVALGHKFLLAEGIERSTEKSAYWYTKAVEQGYEVWRKFYDDEGAKRFYETLWSWMMHALEEYVAEVQAK